MKTELFDRDPEWLGVNNRIAQQRDPVQVRQDFGYSPDTNHAGGASPGEIGGFVTPAGSAAYYGKVIDRLSLDQPLEASGTLRVEKGGTNLLLGFFQSRTVNEWRTPNTVAIRINGRGESFYAYVEYCTAKWRAGGDTTPFPSIADRKTGRMQLLGFPCETSLPWKLAYDPHANDGRGSVTATIGGDTAVCDLDESHKSDGAAFDRFGILNVVKSADSGSMVWLDDVRIQNSDVETFSQDPNWDGRDNRRTIPSRRVRPWFDFGFSDTQFAGGRGRGELGGQIFRGDCRYADRMACYGDRVGPLTLDGPLRASGKIALTRGVSDSTTLLGFYHGVDSMRVNESQDDGLPASVLGIHVEGPSRDGFRFYGVVRTKGAHGQAGSRGDSPLIHPDGESHDWSLDYDPAGAGGAGRVTVTLDGKSSALDLAPGDKTRATTFDRFGIVTSWIDGNGQHVYWDDISYTQGQ